MNVGLIAGRAGRLHGSVLFLGIELLKGIIGLFGRQEALLYPAFGAASGAYSCEAAIAPENLHLLAIFHRAGLAVDGGHLIAKKRLRSGDVGDLLHCWSAPT